MNIGTLGGVLGIYSIVLSHGSISSLAKNHALHSRVARSNVSIREKSRPLNIPNNPKKNPG